MIEVANARINTFGITSPKADVSPSEDPVLEIPVSEFMAVLNSTVELFNDILDIAREERLIEKRKGAELLIKAQTAIMNEKSPIQKLNLLVAYTKMALVPIKEGLKRRPAANATERIIQASTKVKLRAMMLYEHIKTVANGEVGEKRKKDFALGSPDIRLFLAGKEGQAPSRRDAIRAMEKAEKLFPVGQAPIVILS